MSYQPSEAAILSGLKHRGDSRDRQYGSLLEMTWPGLVKTAEQYGVAHQGRTPHEIACAIIDAMYPEVQSTQAVQSDVTSDPDKFNDTMYAQQATPQDRWRFRDVLGETGNDENAWPVDVPGGMAGVGYRRPDGTVVPLDSEGSVMLSGWGPEQVQFLLVSLSSFFEADYVKEFILAIDAAAKSGDTESVAALTGQFITEQNWTNDAQRVNEPPREPSWAFGTQAQEYPTVGAHGSLDAPTEVITTGEVSQYKPGPY